jgi:hypothetical protein
MGSQYPLLELYFKFESSEAWSACEEVLGLATHGMCDFAKALLDVMRSNKVPPFVVPCLAIIKGVPSA